MKNKFLIVGILSFWSTSIFASDGYKKILESWEGPEFANKIKKKMKEETLEVEDVQDILEKCTFFYNKQDVRPLTSRSSGRTMPPLVNTGRIHGKKFYIAFRSKTLGKEHKILEGTHLELIDKKMSNQMCTYNLVEDEETHQFFLKIKKRKEKLNIQEQLTEGTSFRFLSSINLENERAMQLESYVEESKKNLQELKESDKSEENSEDEKNRPKSVRERARKYSISTSQAQSEEQTPKMITRNSSFIQTDLAEIYTREEKKKYSKKLNKKTSGKKLKIQKSKSSMLAKKVVKVQKEKKKGKFNN